MFNCFNCFYQKILLLLDCFPFTHKNPCVAHNVNFVCFWKYQVSHGDIHAVEYDPITIPMLLGPCATYAASCNHYYAPISSLPPCSLCPLMVHMPQDASPVPYSYHVPTLCPILPYASYVYSIDRLCPILCPSDDPTVPVPLSKTNQPIIAGA